nr:MAG TPA: hypothetical protein [Caudoviricetes sp.]
MARKPETKPYPSNSRGLETRQIITLYSQLW